MDTIHPCINKVYHFEDIKAISNYDPDDYVTRIIKIDPQYEIGHLKDFLGDRLTLSNNINVDSIDSFLQVSLPSQVGVGNETVLDETIRSSEEIDHSKLELNPDFIQLLEKNVHEMAELLNHPTNVEIQFYKMVIYRPYDFFDEHIDSNHTDNMIMTLSVEINVNGGRKGGDLIINNSETPQATERELVLTLFYHDVYHKISKLTNGYRLSLIFDVKQIPSSLNLPCLNNYSAAFDSWITKLQKMAINKSLSKLRVGLITYHLYIGDVIKLEDLKGMDNIFYQIIKKYSCTLDLIPLVNDGENWYHSALMDIFGLDKTFGELYYSYDDEDDDDEEEDDDYSYNRSKKHRGNDIDPYQSYSSELKIISDDDYNKIQFNLCYDHKFKALNNNVILGDVILIKTPIKPKLIYNGNSEAHLGNQGFFGQIYQNLAIIATINLT